MKDQYNMVVVLNGVSSKGALVQTNGMFDEPITRYERNEREKEEEERKEEDGEKHENDEIKEEDEES